MSKPVKEMMMRQYRETFADVNDALLVDIRGIEANDNRDLRADLAKKQIRITVVKNHLARKVFADGALAPITELIDGPTAMVYGGESVVDVARAIIDHAKKLENLEVKGALMEGTVFQADEVVRLSQFPTRVEAQAEIVQLLISPAAQIIGAATSAGHDIAGVLSSMIEKLESGEELKKVA